MSTHLESLKLELAKLSPNVLVHVRKFDAADEAAVEAVVREAVEMYGRLDVFFANAGVIGGGKLVEDSTAEAFMDTMRVNALSVFLAVKHAAAGMKVTGPGKPIPGGSIIATASIAGMRSGGGPSMIYPTLPPPHPPSSPSRSSELMAWDSGLFGLQSSGHKRDADVGVPTRRHKHPLQLGLPRTNTDGNDQRPLGGRQEARDRGEDWLHQSDEKGSRKR